MNLEKPFHEKTLDEVVREEGLDKPPSRPVPVEEAELNPDHGPEHVMPAEHQVPLDEARDELVEEKPTA